MFVLWCLSGWLVFISAPFVSHHLILLAWQTPLVSLMTKLYSSYYPCSGCGFGLIVPSLDKACTRVCGRCGTGNDVPRGWGKK